MRKKALSWILTIAMVLPLFAAMPITVAAADYVCEVKGVQYLNLDAAIAAAAPGEDTITLLANIDYEGQIAPTFYMYINLNGHTLNVVNNSGAALLVDGHELNISGEGEFNVTGSDYGVYACNGGKAKVSKATASAAGGRAVYVSGFNSSVTVEGDAVANGENGVAAYTNGDNSCTATIEGDVYANGVGGIGAWADTASQITVNRRIHASNYLKCGTTIKAEGEQNSTVDNYHVYMDGSNAVRARQEVCNLNGTNYLYLEDALAAAGHGDTITLLADIRYKKEIILEGKDLHFNLDIYKLNIGNGTSNPALKVDRGILSIDESTGAGEFNIVAGYIGVKLLNGGSAAVTSIYEERESALSGYGISADGGSLTVTGNIKVTGHVGTAMIAGGGSSIHVLGNIECRQGLTVGGSRTNVVVDGNLIASNGTAMTVHDGASVTVKGNASGAFRGIGAYARSGDGGKVHVLGNVNGAGEYGIEALAGSEVIVDGYVSSLKGLKAYGEGTSITVNGNTTSTGAGEHGASAFEGGLITIGGKIIAPEYVLIEQTTLGEAEGVVKGRYKVYSDGTSTVRLNWLEFFKEDFERGINNPGWTWSGEGWSITDYLNRPAADAHSGNYVAMFNSFSKPSIRGLLYQTESLDLTNGSEYCLEFWMYHDSGQDGLNDRITVQISTDGGVNWSDLETFSRYSETTGWKKESISLFAYTGEPDVRIGFLGISVWGNNIFIDDISVSHKCIIAGCATTDAYGGFIESSEIGGKTYYHVSTPEQLAHINEHPNHNFILTDDIDLSGRQWVPIGKTYESSFNGHFDGNGHSISGMTITRNCGANAYGLFGYLGINGIIENLILESGNIEFSEAAGYGFFGGIVGYSRGLVKNCVNKAHVIIMYGGTYAGGIVGVGNSDIDSLDGWSARIYGCRNEGSIRIEGAGSVGGIIGAQINSNFATYIDQCSNSGTIRGGAGAEAGGIAGRINNAQSIGIMNCFNTGEVYSGGIYTNTAYAGGIVGYDYYSQVKNCYNTGKLRLIYDSLGNTFCGGIAGYAESATTDCYNIGMVIGTNKAGEGIIGNGIPGANCYYLDTSTQSAEVNGIKSLTDAEMKTQASFANWDFLGTWTINRDDNGGYPALAWQGFDNVAASSDATLSALTATAVNLNPVFAAETTDYTANAANNIGSTTVDATASDARAKISIDGTVVTSKELALAVGDNVITIVVTAEDGTSTKTYTITITRAAAPPPPPAPPAGGDGPPAPPAGRQLTV
ncbi:MAG: hypothetical protein GX975_02350, partial [Clostridiales bacterium]|nr:hypothetical protein [Clostridiales bacterium]